MIVNRPGRVRFTYQADPERHDRAASLLAGTEVSGPDALPDAVQSLMRDLLASRPSPSWATTSRTSETWSKARWRSSACWRWSPREVDASATSRSTSCARAWADGSGRDRQPRAQQLLVGLG